jgi:hypothetical protein
MAAAKEVCPRTTLRELEAMSPREFKGAFMSYMLEAEHGSWDGYARSDLTGIRRFVSDFAEYAKVMDDKDEVIYTGSEYFNKEMEKK